MAVNAKRTRRATGTTRARPSNMSLARTAAFAGVARDLLHTRKELLRSIPFGSALPGTRFDLERVAAPVVAVTGPFSAGKSSIINRFISTAPLPTGVVPTTAVPVRVRAGKEASCWLGTPEGVVEGPVARAELEPLIRGGVPSVQQVALHLPEMSSSPCEWLDLPGTNADGPWRHSVGPVEAAAADICVLVTSALQPLSLTDVRQLLQLNSLFANGLVLVVNRWDQVAETDRTAVRSHISGVLQDVLPGNSLPLHYVSAKSGEGISDLGNGLLALLLPLQQRRLEYELSSFKRLLADLQKLMSLKALGLMRPEVVSAAREALLSILLERGVALKRQLPAMALQIEARLATQIPNTQRALFNEGRAQFDAAMRGALERIAAELFAELRRHLTGQGHGVSAQLVDEALRAFTAVGQFGLPDFVDPKSALAGAGMAALFGGALAALSLPLAGIAGIALASGLAGGLLGGYLGDGDTISDIGTLRRGILDNLAAASMNSVEGAIQHAQHDVTHFCDLMAQAANIFSRPDNQAAPAEEVLALIRVARRAVDGLQARFISSQFSVATAS